MTSNRTHEVMRMADAIGSYIGGVDRIDKIELPSRLFDELRDEWNRGMAIDAIKLDRELKMKWTDHILSSFGLYKPPIAVILSPTVGKNEIRILLKEVNLE